MPGESSDGKRKLSELKIGTGIMSKNDAWAVINRTFFRDKGVFALNLISSPGSGKTTLLQALARRFGSEMAVIVGDLQTHRDADRIISSGSAAHQIETGGACHLDAEGVHRALGELDFSGVRLTVIENVGNLVCPAAYDLGEHIKAAVLSTPEGDDKVLKYPSIFSRIDVLIINKIDLLPYLTFDPERAVAECRSLKRDVRDFRISATTGEGTDALFEYLKGRMGQPPSR